MPDSAIVKSFSYKPKKLMMLLCVVMFGPAAWFFMHLAQTNDRGLIIVISRNLLEIPLDTYQTTIFHWVLCALSFCFAILGLVGIYKSFTSKAEIILTEEEITIPKGMFSITNSITIPYKDIKFMEIYSINRTRLLRIVHAQGKVNVSEGMLPKKAQLDELYKLIEKRIKHKDQN